MKEKIKTMLHSLYAVGTALLFIVLLEMPYLWELTGYDMLTMYEAGVFGEFLVSFFAFFQVVFLLLLLNVGFLGILHKTGVVEIKKSLKNWTYAKLVGILLIVVACMSLLELIFIINTCYKFAVSIGVGAILNPVLQIMVCVIYYLLDKNKTLDGEFTSRKKRRKKSEPVVDAVEIEEKTVEEVKQPTEEVEEQVEQTQQTEDKQ